MESITAIRFAFDLSSKDARIRFEVQQGQLVNTDCVIN
jgi:hypothetical protein